MVWRRANARDFGKGSEAGGEFSGEFSPSSPTVSHPPCCVEGMTYLQIMLDASRSEDAKVNGVSKACEVEEVSAVEPPSEPPDAELFLFFPRPHFLN